MTQTASSPQLTVSVPAQDAAAQEAKVQDFAPEAQGIAGVAGPLGGEPLAAIPLSAVPIAAVPLVQELEPALGLAAAVIEEEGDALSEVWRTSSHLESMQWELDSAQESLRQAVRNASAAGVAREELCTAANLTADELTAVLMPASGGPGVIQL
ncbi:hypothetical protein [Arthrobacter sp. Soil764]|uniref:hypothetical protein n=1 Tax=Arthrobacter sp. Soil764 TaxID=1736403 RepID=UPI0006F57E5A|nr:hypothetical protein [Arthrobacter sp. Soil764]KRE81314.1 hypothetical protein ASG86_12265 [Arthrobacter sp. Soil764]